MAGETPGAAFAATWRNEQGAVVGTTYGGTMCLWPRKPWRIRITREGFEHVIRCGECPGCLEFERRRLADRLQSKYAPGGARGAEPKTGTGKLDAENVASATFALFVVRIWAPLELHASIASKLHRRRGLGLEPGMWRLGASSFAILARSRVGLPEVLRALGYRFRIEPLRLKRGRRAWRVLTAGLIVAREIYGEQRNRFYARGLPKADRLKWEVKKIGKYDGYSRNASPRAWTGRRVVLVPPDVWKLRPTVRRSLRGLLLRQSDPEGVRRVMGIVAGVSTDQARRFNVSAAAEGRPTREQVVQFYNETAKRVAARCAIPVAAPDHTPSSGEGGYVSSEHKQGELMPLELARARQKEWQRRRDERAKKESMEIIERMKRKSRGED